MCVCVRARKLGPPVSNIWSHLLLLLCTQHNASGRARACAYAPNWGPANDQQRRRSRCPQRTKQHLRLASCNDNRQPASHDHSLLSTTTTTTTITITTAAFRNRRQCSVVGNALAQPPAMIGSMACASCSCPFRPINQLAHQTASQRKSAQGVYQSHKLTGAPKRCVRIIAMHI